MAHPGSATRGHPATLTGGAGDTVDDAWYEEYFADFTESFSGFDTDIAHNETFVELGVRADGGTAPTWKAEEDDASDAEDIRGYISWVDGEGLKILAKAGSNTEAAINAPCFSVALTDCVPNLTDQDVICVQVFVNEPSAPTTDHEGLGFLIYDGGAATLGAVGKWIQYRCWHNSSGPERVWRVSGDAGGHYTDENDPGGLSSIPRSLEIVLYMAGGEAICAHSTSTSLTATPLGTVSTNRSWVTGGGLGGAGKYGSFTAPTRHLDKANMRIGLTGHRLASTSSYFHYVSAVRILRLAGRAGGAD